MKTETAPKTFPTAEEAMKAVNGKKKAFKITLGDKTVYAVANNSLRAAGAAMQEMGAIMEEIGKAGKPMTAGAIFAAIMALPDSEKEALNPLLKSLNKKK